MIVRTCVFGNPYPGQYSTNYYGLSTTAGGSAFGYMLLAAWPMDVAACGPQTPPPPPPPPPVASLPCLPFTYGGGAAALDCSGYAGHAWSVSARVQSQCPINEVLRAPYPRTLVAMDTVFKLLKTRPDTQWSASLTHPEVADGSALEPDGAPKWAGLFRDLRIGLQSSRLSPAAGFWLDQPIPAPAWHFSDHTWNAAHRRYPADQRSTGNGIDSDADALFAYETSSWGLPQLGRNFDFALDRPADRYDLPAYRVSLAVACGHEWRVTWDESIRVVVVSPYMDGQCFMSGAIQAGDDPTLRSSGDNCPPGMEHYWNEISRYRWDHRDTGWNKIDLRTAAGLGTPYFMVYATRPGGAFKNQLYWEGDREIRVPVIEVQSVARPGCFAAGACAGAQAEPEALVPVPAARVDPP